MMDLMPRSSVEPTTAEKPTKLKLSSPTVHIITPPHMGRIARYLRSVYCLPTMARISNIVKKGEAADTIWENDTKIKRSAMLPSATEAQKASASLRTLASVSGLMGLGSAGRKAVASASPDKDQQQSMCTDVSITCRRAVRRARACRAGQVGLARRKTGAAARAGAHGVREAVMLQNPSVEVANRNVERKPARQGVEDCRYGRPTPAVCS
jgi:hypothetical protein